MSADSEKRSNMAVTQDLNATDAPVTTTAAVGAGSAPIFNRDQDSLLLSVFDDEPNTALEESDETFKYRWSEYLPFGIRHLYYLIISIIGIVVLLIFVLPSMLLITLFGALFGLICCDDSSNEKKKLELNSVEIMYKDIHLWLLCNKYKSFYVINIFYIIFWHWLNYTANIVNYIFYLKMRANGDEATYNGRLSFAEYYGDYQPFVCGLTCTNYKIISDLLMDKNGTKDYIFQTHSSQLLKSYCKFSAPMLSTNTTNHKHARAIIMAFLKPVFKQIKVFEREEERIETLERSNDDNKENENASEPLEIVEEFYKIYQPRMDELMEKIQKEIQTKIATQDTNDNTNNRVSDDILDQVFDEMDREIQVLIIHILFYFWFYDKTDRKYINMEKSPLQKDDIDRLINEVLDNINTILLPQFLYLPLSTMIIYFENKLSNALLNFRNFFVKFQECSSMRSMINYIETNNLNMEESLYSFVCTIMIAALIGTDTPTIKGLKLFFQDYYKYKTCVFDGGFGCNNRNSKRRFIKEIVRWLGVLPGTNTMILNQDKEITIRNKKYNIPKGTPILCLIGRANRDIEIFDENTVNDIKPDRQNLNKILSWNGREEYIMNKTQWDKVPRYVSRTACVQNKFCLGIKTIQTIQAIGISRVISYTVVIDVI